MPFRGLVLLNTILLFMVLLILERVLEPPATRMAAAPILTIAFASGSAVALFASRRYETHIPLWERWLFVVVAFAIWLGVGASDLFGPRHSSEVLVNGGFVLAGTIGYDLLREVVRRARRPRP